MISLLLMTILPLLAPYAAWYLWQIFVAAPRIDPATGDQLPPDFSNAPKGKLLLAAVGSMILVIGIFLAVHDQFADEPYAPISVEEGERNWRSPGEAK